MNLELLQILKSVHPRGVENKVKSVPHLDEFVENHWNVLWGPARIYLEKVWHAAHGTTPICAEGKKMGWLGVSQGTAYCGKQCKCAQERKRKTMQERYGVDHALQSPAFNEKMKSSLMSRYGTDVLSSINIDQREKTNQERYGAKTPFESKEILERTRKSLRKSHGVDYPFHDTDLQRSIQTRWLEKNGKRSFSRGSDEVKAQALGMLVDKFGDNSRYLIDKDLFSSTLRVMSRIELANHIGCSKSLIDRRIQEWDLSEFKEQKSHYETVIARFLSDSGISYVENCRKIITPKELDWWIDQKNLGIEFCGLRWHGESSGRGKHYHLDKLMAMRDRSCGLIQIFQDEWDERSNIVKSIISHRLSISSDQRIPARKCQVRELKQKEYTDLMETSHVQGSSKGDFLRIGLIHDDTLIAAMGIRHNRKYQWEISRHANRLGYHVLGGFGKMFSYLRKKLNPVAVLSYADLRYFTGESLRIHGFEHEGDSSPGYWYTRGVKRYHRLRFTKKRLIQQGENPNMTETEMMAKNGYDRIWDCGHARWVWRATTSENT